MVILPLVPFQVHKSVAFFISCASTSHDFLLGLPWVAFKKVTYFLQRFFPRSVLYPVLIMIGFVKKLYKRALIYLILVWIFRFQIKLVWIRVFFHFLFLAAMVSSTWLSLWWLFPISQAFW
jgi:hypothetical protein